MEFNMGSKTCNKLVAVEPFPAGGIEKTVNSGFVVVASQKEALTSLKVVLPNQDGSIQPGMLVWVRGDLSKQDWAQKTQTIGGKTFILMSETHIQVITNPPYAT